jgi:hypothetical protein
VKLCPIFYVFSRFRYSSVQGMFPKLAGFELRENRHSETRKVVDVFRSVFLHIISDLDLIKKKSARNAPEKFHCFTVHFSSLCVTVQLMHLFVIKH